MACSPSMRPVALLLSSFLAPVCICCSFALAFLPPVCFCLCFAYTFLAPLCFCRSFLLTFPFRLGCDLLRCWRDVVCVRSDLFCFRCIASKGRLHRKRKSHKLISALLFLLCFYLRMRLIVHNFCSDDLSICQTTGRYIVIG